MQKMWFKEPRNKKIFISIILAVGIVSIPFIIYFLVRPGEENLINEPVVKGGIVTQDETWSGMIFVNQTILVPKGVTLTILPGTQINFKPNRDYKSLEYVGLTVVEGTIIANGTSTEQIWFTSDTEVPINGDWGGIELYNTSNSIFNYVILEYADIGIAQFDSKVNICHSIIRWVNSEGIYMERSAPLIEYNLLYQNGYHEIALEQYNYDVVIRNNTFAGGHVPFIAIDSNITLQGNYFYNYNNTDLSAVQVAGVSNAIVIGNRFEGFLNNTAIKKIQNSSILISINNDFGTGFIPIPELDFADVKHSNLGYTPGDPEDQYMYVYPPIGETRRVESRIGGGLGFGWALEYVNGSIWKLETGKLLKINITTSNYTEYSVNTSQILGPRGLCYDGEFFWTQDHSLLNIVKFKINGTAVIVHDSFPIPESETGGRQGLATDGTYLYISNRAGTKLFELNKTGSIIRTIDFNGIDSPLTWNGTHFWSIAGNTLIAWTKDGEIVGEIYNVAVGGIGVSWDGNYLWGIYRTCETWSDAKIFQIEILDDSLINS